MYLDISVQRCGDGMELMRVRLPDTETGLTLTHTVADLTDRLCIPQLDDGDDFDSSQPLPPPISPSGFGWCLSISVGSEIKSLSPSTILAFLGVFVDTHTLGPLVLVARYEAVTDPGTRMVQCEVPLPRVIVSSNDLENISSRIHSVGRRLDLPCLVNGDIYNFITTTRDSIVTIGCGRPRLVPIAIPSDLRGCYRQESDEYTHRTNPQPSAARSPTLIATAIETSGGAFVLRVPSTGATYHLFGPQDPDSQGTGVSTGLRWVPMDAAHPTSHTDPSTPTTVAEGVMRYDLRDGAGSLYFIHPRGCVHIKEKSFSQRDTPSASLHYLLYRTANGTWLTLATNIYSVCVAEGKLIGLTGGRKPHFGMGSTDVVSMDLSPLGNVPVLEENISSTTPIKHPRTVEQGNPKPWHQRLSDGSYGPKGGNTLVCFYSEENDMLQIVISGDDLNQRRVNVYPPNPGTNREAQEASSKTPVIDGCVYVSHHHELVRVNYTTKETTRLGFTCLSQPHFTPCQTGLVLDTPDGDVVYPLDYEDEGGDMIIGEVYQRECINGIVVNDTGAYRVVNGVWQ
ncbi:hypothetical protein KIPB_001536 [Kipferlia bialata]|uniref:Uncharacterized protein n=1 Tax=Kipferlia bialata TaxID=797122 RepID=A0A9K3GF92_9EUKA|nr:hypothetical protein KIPB_001536 [Kipferlia bialata]|eukprot:g1536.t1